MRQYTYRTIIEPDQDGFHGYVPTLKGVHTFGKTIEEARKNLAEAIKCHLEGLLKDKETPPEESQSFEVIQTVTLHA